MNKSLRQIITDWKAERVKLLDLSKGDLSNMNLFDIGKFFALSECIKSIETYNENNLKNGAKN